MPIIKIVSGGQTGADMGVLEAALYCDVPHGDWCPKGRMAEDWLWLCSVGVEIDIKTLCGLRR